MKRRQSDRDAEAGLHEALMALVAMAERKRTARACRAAGYGSWAVR